MRIIITDTDEEAGEIAAQQIEREIRSGRLRTLGVATGSSPLAIYKKLATYDTVLFRPLQVFALDEYVGLEAGDPHSYAHFVDEEITKPLSLHPDRVHVPDGSAPDILGSGERYETAISDAGGIDLQILGIGRNGHIGFNEPGSSLSSRTRVKTLAEQTVRDNSRFFAPAEHVPELCITQGLGTILDARQVILVASGAHKAASVAAAFEGPVTAMCPASVLQLHPHVTVVIDSAAAAELALSSYYLRARAHEVALLEGASL